MAKDYEHSGTGKKREPGYLGSLGSATIISSDGLLLTAAHVVYQMTESETFDALKVIGNEPSNVHYLIGCIDQPADEQEWRYVAELLTPLADLQKHHNFSGAAVSRPTVEVDLALLRITHKVVTDPPNFEKTNEKGLENPTQRHYDVKEMSPVAQDFHCPVSVRVADSVKDVVTAGQTKVHQAGFPSPKMTVTSGTVGAGLGGKKARKQTRMDRYMSTCDVVTSCNDGHLCTYNLMLDGSSGGPCMVATDRHEAELVGVNSFSLKDKDGLQLDRQLQHARSVDVASCRR